MTLFERIREKAVEMLANEPDGLGYAHMTQKVGQCLPSVKQNSIYSALWNLDTTKPELV